MSFTDFNSATPNPEVENVLDVDPTELNNINADIQLIDVRRPDEYIGELGHIHGAELITLDFLSDKLSGIDKSKTVVFICRSGRRSAHAAQLAKAAGFLSAYNMKGGMLQWNQLGFSTEV